MQPPEYPPLAGCEYGPGCAALGFHMFKGFLQPRNGERRKLVYPDVQSPLHHCLAGLVHFGLNNSFFIAVLNMLAIWKTQQWPQDWKRSVFIPILKKGNAKECSNYHTITLISHTSKVMLKILQARLQQYINHELPDVQAGFRKRQRNQRSNCQYLLDHQKSKRVPEKHLLLLY